MTERLETENSYEDQVRRGRELSYAVVDALAEYGALPSEVRVELAWRAIAHYHTAAAVWGGRAFRAVRVLRSYEYPISLKKSKRQQSSKPMTGSTNISASNLSDTA